jgi:hypothetical protein
MGLKCDPFPLVFSSGEDATDPRVERIMHALLDRQRQDGGWRPFWAQESSPLYTLLAVEVLILTGMLARGELEAAVRPYAA